MARIRTIKPEFWTDDALTECSLSARLLFIGTWNFADDCGNLDRSAKQIKSRVFPADEINCEPLIRELLAHGLLTEYAVSDKKYLNIRNFLKHQIINRPSKPTCPAFNEALRTHGGLTECSLITPGALTTEGKGREGSKHLRKSKPELNGAFTDFWAAYPRKKSKGQAEKAWISIKPDEQLQDRIITAVERAKTSVDWRRDGGKFIPYPASWLNAKGWEDEPTSHLPQHDPNRLVI